MKRFVLATTLGTAQLIAAAGIAQAQATLFGRVTGDEGEAIPGATVQICDAAARTVSQRDGWFALSLESGTYRLCVRRIGYQQFDTEVRVARGGAADTVRVVLTAAANELRGLIVTGDRDVPMISTLTTATVRQAPPLGEADIFRTLALLPEVLQANDLTARVHLAGGASDEHSTTIDGHALQSPFHAASTVGAFNVAALDRAELRVHHLPADQDGYLSGNVRLETVRPSIEPSRELVLTLLSASATVTQPLPGGVDVLVSGRTSYIDKVLAAYLRRSGSTSDDLIFPGFSDLLVRASREWRNGWAVEALGYTTRDAEAERNTLANEQPARWGEVLGGLNVRYRAPSWSMQLQLSSSRADVERRELRRALGEDSLALDDSRISQNLTTSTLTLERQYSKVRLRSGVSVRNRTHLHRWSDVFADQLLRSAVPASIDTVTRQTRGAVFAEAQWRLNVRWALSAGTHVSRLADAWYVAPRVQLTYEYSPSLSLNFALNRRHQFDAIAGEPLEGSVTQPVFLLTRPRVADVAALSTDWTPDLKLGGGRVRVNSVIYARDYRDRTLATTGSLINSAGVDQENNAGGKFQRIPGRTYGLQLTTSVATPSGTALQVSYAGQRATETVAGEVVPTAWDSPHQFSAFASLPMSDAWRFNVAAQLRSGTAVTPVAARVFVPLLDNNRYLTRFLYGPSRSARLPGYARVDVGAQYQWRARGADWTFSMQIVNALARINGLEYDWRTYFACVEQPASCEAGGARRRSLPLLPSLGVSVRW